MILSIELIHSMQIVLHVLKLHDLFDIDLSTVQYDILVRFSNDQGQNLAIDDEWLPFVVIDICFLLDFLILAIHVSTANVVLIFIVSKLKLGYRFIMGWVTQMEPFQVRKCCFLHRRSIS